MATRLIAPTRKKEKKEKSLQHHGQERLKIVIRRLPPNLPEDIFWQSVQQWVSDDTATWKTYHQGKFRSRLNKENISSRAYVSFKSEEQLTSFHRDYDGHIFRDKSGSYRTSSCNESQAVVEYAPYQKIPSDKKKADARLGTIEQDEDYISFVQSLQSAGEPATIEALVASLQPAPQPKTTPLLEALKAEKVAAKEAKEKMLLMRSHHAHPTEVLTRKDDGKKKAAPSKAAEAPPLSKKAAKKAAALANAVGAGSGVDPAHAGNASPASRKAPKAPRAPREQQQQSSPAQANSASAAAAASSASATTSNEGAAPAARRSRPILGLGSRQFEAALSGVAGGKARKEKEKEGGQQKESAQEKKGAPATVNGEGSKPKETTSPKRERAARHRDASAAGKGQSSVQGILQRGDGPPPAILQRDQKPAATAAAGNVEQGSSNAGPPPGLGRGRGRGRGRGGRGGGPMGRGGGSVAIGHHCGTDHPLLLVFGRANYAGHNATSPSYKKQPQAMSSRGTSSRSHSSTDGKRLSSILRKPSFPTLRKSSTGTPSQVPSVPPMPSYIVVTPPPRPAIRPPQALVDVPILPRPPSLDGHYPLPPATTGHSYDPAFMDSNRAVSKPSSRYPRASPNSRLGPGYLSGPPPAPEPVDMNAYLQPLKPSPRRKGT
ncbi:hypothetical protein V5O48_005867 [Marasmius crinis-equi]|uniref:UPF3 domain-containing protein n=1 Tax=Marasmius crinis-equi TaxID=585013 RepID=A0ABR3FL45_9AGAR